MKIGDIAIERKDLPSNNNFYSNTEDSLKMIQEVLKGIVLDMEVVIKKHNELVKYLEERDATRRQ